MNRRDLMGWVGVGAIASWLPMALAACTPQSNDTSEPDEPATETPPPEAATPDPAASSGEFAPVGTVADLDANGSLVDKAFAAGPVIVIRDPETAEAVIALDPRCPHQGCAVEWQPDAAEFVCPCHRSKFGPDGSVTNGPATTNLPSYSAKIEGDQVLVAAS